MKYRCFPKVFQEEDPCESLYRYRVTEMPSYHPIVEMQMVQMRIVEQIDKLFDWINEISTLEDEICNVIGFDPYE